MPPPPLSSCATNVNEGALAANGVLGLANFLGSSVVALVQCDKTTQTTQSIWIRKTRKAKRVSSLTRRGIAGTRGCSSSQRARHTRKAGAKRTRQKEQNILQKRADIDIYIHTHTQLLTGMHKYEQHLNRTLVCKYAIYFVCVCVCTCCRDRLTLLADFLWNCFF